MDIKAKLYIYTHVLLTLVIIIFINHENRYDVSLLTLVPFIIFGCLFETLRLIAFSIKGQELTISSGAAVILAGIILFNPLELIIFAGCYGISILLFPFEKNLYKIVFNLCQTINITFISYLVWHSLNINTVNLLDVQNLLPLVITMMVFVVLDILSVSIIISLASGMKFKEIIKDSFGWITVMYTLIAFIGLILAVMYQVFYIYGLIGFVIPLLLMRFNMFLFSKEKEKQVEQLRSFNKMLKTNNEQLILTLSQIIDARDNSLLGHSQSVARYSVDIGKKLGFSEDDLYDLKRGALLHDIGKLGISEAILQKPGRLTEEEFHIIKDHTLIGEKITNQVTGLEKVSKIIGQHHEHYNGRGYPYQLKEEEILLESRIITLCDSVDTMLSTRSYKKGWTIEEVRAEVIKCSGTHFDPKVVGAFIELLDENDNQYFKDSSIISNDGEDLQHLLYNV